MGGLDMAAAALGSIFRASYATAESAARATDSLQPQNPRYSRFDLPGVPHHRRSRRSGRNSWRGVLHGLPWHGQKGQPRDTDVEGFRQRAETNSMGEDLQSSAILPTDSAI